MSGRAELSFFPKVAGTADAASQMFEQFVMDDLSKSFGATRCESVQDYGKGVIYGYDAIAI